MVRAGARSLQSWLLPSRSRPAVFQDLILRVLCKVSSRCPIRGSKSACFWDIDLVFRFLLSGFGVPCLAYAKGGCAVDVVLGFRVWESTGVSCRFVRSFHKNRQWYTFTQYTMFAVHRV